MPAKSSLVDPAIRRAAEDTAHVLVFIDHLRRILDHDLDGILITQPVRTFDGVEDVRINAVAGLITGRHLFERAFRAGTFDWPRIPQCGSYTALRRAAVRS